MLADLVQYVLTRGHGPGRLRGWPHDLLLHRPFHVLACANRSFVSSVLRVSGYFSMLADLGQYVLTRGHGPGADFVAGLAACHWRV